MSHRSELMETIRTGVLHSKSDLPEPLREAVYRRATTLVCGKHRGHSDLPRPLDDLVDKVAVASYKVTDSDFEALKAAGYSEDAVFMAIAVTAVGAGLGRLQLGLKALRKET